MNLDVARTILMDHSRSSHNGRFPEDTNLEGKLTNPVCGDHVVLKLSTVDSIIQDIGFKAEACAICSASASLLCRETKGHSVETVLKLATLFERCVLESSDHPWPEELQNLHCFEHLRVNPSRKVCALLPWVALRSTLKKAQRELV
jgi:nitrogen fixation NifU-like protein